MDTLITIKLTNKKAYKLLQDMEELDLIKVIEKSTPGKLSSLRGKIQTSMNDKDIENQLKEIRQEWQRVI